MNTKKKYGYEAVVIGVSSGGMKALRALLSGLDDSMALPMIVVQHISPQSEGSWLSMLTDHRPVKEAEDKEKIEAGTMYIAPPNYHLLINRDKTFTLTICEKVNFARPSVDVLFESAADVYASRLIGVILTGAGRDGAAGLCRVMERGGMTVIQDPATAEMRNMPEAAIAAVRADHILPLAGIARLLNEINNPYPITS